LKFHLRRSIRPVIVVAIAIVIIVAAANRTRSGEAGSSRTRHGEILDLAKHFGATAHSAILLGANIFKPPAVGSYAAPRRSRLPVNKICRLPAGEWGEFDRQLAANKPRRDKGKPRPLPCARSPVLPSI
jgi:hypothetical protein